MHEPRTSPSTFRGTQSTVAVTDRTLAGETATLGPPPDAGSAWVSPRRMSHYVLLDKLGEGGMGVIYAAYDEQLDRKVAIKLLRHTGANKPRLIREAQALARLSHANVVRVYEIGEWAGAPFIVMEFVDGVTLGTWLTEAARSLAEIVAVFTAAGRGLAAAHAKGLVHRDFKPANVMIDRDGRVLVMDFGLARCDEDDEELQTISSENALRLVTERLTLTGTVMGTPAYMSPQQLRGLPTDAKTDQFSFCVSLWEAVHGERPFAGDSFAELSEAVISGELGPVRDPRVPAWQHRVLARGLANKPGDRWSSMEALLDALAADPTGSRRRIAGGVALGAVALALAAGSVGWTQAQNLSEQRERAAMLESCTHDSRAFTEVWNADRGGAVAEAFAATGLAHAQASAAVVHDQLDDYAGEWARLHRGSCVATRLYETREPELHARVVECLDENRALVETLVEAWTLADRATVNAAVGAAVGLPRLSRCVDEHWLASRPPLPEGEETRARIAAARGDLQRASALFLAGKYDDARSVAQAAVAIADTVDWDPLSAEAHLSEGVAAKQLADYEAAEELLTRAFDEAGRSGHDLIAVRAASGLGHLEGIILAEHEPGLRWINLGKMFVERMDLHGTMDEASLISDGGGIAWSMGDAQGALAAFETSLAIQREIFGVDHPTSASSLSNIGLAHQAAGDDDAALAAHEQALAIREAVLGPEHPAVGISLGNIGPILLSQGKYAQALANYERAQTIQISALGPEHPQVAGTIHSIGVVLEKTGDLDGALATYRRALALQERTLGADHPRTAHLHSVIGDLQLSLGEYAAARSSAERSLEILAAHPGDPIYAAYARSVLARALAQLGEDARARELAGLAAVEFEAAGATDEARELEAWFAGRGRR